MRAAGLPKYTGAVEVGFGAGVGAGGGDGTSCASSALTKIGSAKFMRSSFDKNEGDAFAPPSEFSDFYQRMLTNPSTRRGSSEMG
jgi:hypothetical protein